MNTPNRFDPPQPWNAATPQSQPQNHQPETQQNMHGHPAQYPYAGPPIPPQKKHSTGRTLLFIVAGCVGLVILGNVLGGSDDTDDSDVSPPAPSSSARKTTDPPRSRATDTVKEPTTPPSDSSQPSVVIGEAVLSTNYKDEPVIVVDFVYTNNEDTAESFMWSFDAVAFQNGIELDDFAIGVDETEDSLVMADIKPGTTVTVKVAFVLRDESPVTVEVSELISFDDTILATKEFTITP